MTQTVRSSPLALTVLGMLHTRPLHPYGIQRLIKQWGKDQVVNVGQRTALYRTIERLEDGGLIAVQGTGQGRAVPGADRLRDHRRGPGGNQAVA